MNRAVLERMLKIMNIVYKKRTELIPYEKNPRKNEEAARYVAKSINDFGFLVPILITKDNVVVAGHTRLKAAEINNIDEVPCIIADGLSKEKINAFRLIDNKSSEIAEWDNDLLKAEVQDLLDSIPDLEEYNFNIDDFTNDDVFEDINDNGYAETTRFEHKLKIDRQEIVITEEEYKKIIDLFNKYVNENGVSFGFVNYLVGGFDD